MLTLWNNSGTFHRKMLPLHQGDVQIYTAPAIRRLGMLKIVCILKRLSIYSLLNGLMMSTRLSSPICTETCPSLNGQWAW